MSTNFPKSGVRKALIRGGGRRNNICVSISLVVGGETCRRQGICKRLRATRYYSLLCLSGTGRRCTLVVAEPEAIREFGANSEEVKLREEKV